MRMVEIVESKKRSPRKEKVDTTPTEINTNTAALFIEKNCQPWLSQTDYGKQMVFRGFGDSDSQLSDAFVRNVRSNRKSSGPTWVHKGYIEVIKDAGFTANRHNSVIVTGNHTQAKDFAGSEVYVVLPIGEFYYTWSTELEDWGALGFEISPMSSDNFKTYFENTYGTTLKGDDGTLQQAIHKGHEIMIACEKYVAVNLDVYEPSVLPKLGQGK